MTDDHEPGVLATCQDLHLLAMGSMDGVPPEECERMEAYLQRKLDGWRDYPAIGAIPGAYDNVVKALIVIALAEWRACPWNTKNGRAEAAP